MNIPQIQDKILTYSAQGSTDEEIYKILGFAEWDDYQTAYKDIWTPEFRYRLYILHNPHSTMEQAFLRGVQLGWYDGFDDGYNAALEDLENGTSV